MKSHFDEKEQINGIEVVLALTGFVMLVSMIGILFYNGYMSDPVRIAIELDKMR